MFTLPERYNVSVLLDSNLDAGRGDKVAIYCADERLTYGDLFKSAPCPYLSAEWCEA